MIKTNRGRQVHNADLNRSEIAHLILLVVLTLQNLYFGYTIAVQTKTCRRKKLIALDTMIDVNARVPN